MALITGPSQGLISRQEVAGSVAAIVPLAAHKASEAIKSAAGTAGMRQTQIRSQGGEGQYQGKKQLALTHLRVREETNLLVRWRGLDRRNTLVEWVAYTQHGYGQPVLEQAGMSEFARWLDGAVRLALSAPQPEPAPRDPVVPPGREAPKRYEGQLYDYSALAAPQDLGAFGRGVLPLGRAAFGWPPEAWRGDPLRMPVMRGAPLEELGVLLCAPQGAGKTRLLVSWAAAAAREGRTVFIVDVKGNMREELEAALARYGADPEILEFTTDAYGASDRLNLLTGLSVDQKDYREQFMLIAEALMPSDAFDGRGEEVDRHEIAVRILCGGLQVLKLMEWYGVYEGGRPTDLVDLQKLLARETEVLGWITFLQQHEAWARANDKPTPRCSIEECIDLMSLALGRQWMRRMPDGSLQAAEFPEGERAPEYRYQQYLVTTLKTLDGFRTGGAMAERVRSFGPGREIRLDQIGRDGRAPVILLTARETDSKLASRILDMAMRRLRQGLDRRRTARPDELGEVLLLLDETVRIPGFDPAEFVSIVRQNRVGYVLVYQALDLIRPREKAETLLSNIGTQIYLGGLSGADLELFNKHRPEREQVRQWSNRQSNSNGSGTGSSDAGRNVPFLSALAAARFPAGRFPALIAVRDGPAPFLTDLEGL